MPREVLAHHLTVPTGAHMSLTLAMATTALAMGLAAWRRIQPLVRHTGGVWVAGALWTFMPCGLLFSALLVAALSGGPLEGALSMALFAAGSSLGLMAGPVRAHPRCGQPLAPGLGHAHRGWPPGGHGGLRVVDGPRRTHRAVVRVRLRRAGCRGRQCAAPVCQCAAPVRWINSIL